MAKQINTRIQLKYDSYASWTSANPVLLAGEIAIAHIQSGNTQQVNSVTPPQCLIKVGDGTSKYNSLPFISALAADVYSWAKADEAAHKEWLKTNHADTDTQYIFSTNGDKLVVKKALYTNGVKGAEEPVGEYEFLSETEVKDILKDYYTKDEADDKFALATNLGNVATLKTTAKTAVGAINELDAKIGDLSALDEALDNPASLVAAINKTFAAVEAGGTGSVVTVAKEASATAGSKVTYVVKQGGTAVAEKIEIPDITEGATNGTISYGGTDVAVKGLGTAAYASTSELLNTASGYVTELQTNLINGGITVNKADSAVYATEANYVSNTLEITLNSEQHSYDGRSPVALDIDSAIADAIAAEGHPEYTVAKVATTTGYSATYQLQKDGVAVGAKIDIPKDMVVSKGEVITYDTEGAWGAAGTYIVLTLANATSDTLYIPANGLIEYVTSGSTSDSQVIVNIDADHKVTATIGAGKVTATELAKDVNDDIAEGVAAYGWGDHAEEGYAHKVDGATANHFAALDANGDLVDSGKKAADFQPAGNYKTQQKVKGDDLTGATVVGEWEQDENGVITIGTRTLTPADIGAQPVGNYLTVDEFNNADTANIVVDNKKISLAANIKVNSISDAAGSTSITFGEANTIGELYVNASTCMELTANGPIDLSGLDINAGGPDTSNIDLTARKVAVEATSFKWNDNPVRTMADKITSDDFSDEVFIFNCGTASTVL